MFLKNKKIRIMGLFVFALSLFMFVNAPKAMAATITWDGGGADNLFSNATNWVGDVAPAGGDALIFPASVSAQADRVASDDLGFTYIGITFSGVTSSCPGDGAYDYFWYRLLGTVTVNGVISNQMTGVCTGLLIYADVSAAGALTYEGKMYIGGDGIGGSTKTTAIGSNSLTLLGSVVGMPTMLGSLTGSGSLTIDGYPIGSGGGGCDATTTPRPIAGDASGFTGSITVQSDGGLTVSSQSADPARNASSIIKASDGSIIFGLDYGQDMSFSKQISYAGGDVTLTQNRDGSEACLEGGKKTLTLSGNQTFTADTTFYLENVDLKFTGTITGKGYIKIRYYSSGVITFPDNSTLSATPITTDYTADSSATYIYVLRNDTAIVTGHYGDTYVYNGGTLKGTGTVGALVVSSGGTVLPGLSPGCLNTGNLTEGGTYVAEIGGTTACTGYDRINVTGTVDLTNGTLTTSLYNSYKPKVNESYIIVNNDGSDAVTGTFTGLAEGVTFAVNGYTFQITYKGGDGNDVVLTVKNVPAVPDAGFKMLTTNPLAILATSITCAGGILYASRRYNKGVANKA